MNMRIYKSITLLIFLNIFTLNSQNQSSIITLSSFEETWNYALKNNPDQKSYMLNIENGKLPEIGIRKVMTICATLGLELTIKDASQRPTLQELITERD